jgi:hypothetical protein
MPASPTATLQGIEVPQSSVDPTQFFALTRRLNFLTKTGTYAGLGSTDTVQILQTGIISNLNMRFSGSVTVTPGTGTVASTARWPYDLPRAVRFSANGQSNLINVSGAKLKAREIMAGDYDDRGVTQSVGGASVNQGTMSFHNEMWGVGQSQSGIAANTFPVELTWNVPVAFDRVSLVGAIFAQTSATDLTLSVDWAPLTDLFTLTGNAAVAINGTLIVEAEVFTIPQASNGQIIVPDLSTFHALTQSSFRGIGNGDNEIRFAGQGVGKQLMRTYWQVWNGTPAAPLPVNATNFGHLAWRFGGNDTPESYIDGRSMAYNVERTFNSDLSSLQGIAAFDFASTHAFRDSVDEGTATELRLLVNVASGVSLTTPVVEYVSETLAVGAAV